MSFRVRSSEAYPAGVAVRDVLYSLYERRLVRKLAGKPRPRHVGVILDGNRRWAREAGFDDPNEGHHVGARKIEKSGGDLARHLHSAADVLSHTPLVGAKVRKPAQRRAIPRLVAMQAFFEQLRRETPGRAPL